jgi:hypothetical protein
MRGLDKFCDNRQTDTQVSHSFFMPAPGQIMHE